MSKSFFTKDTAKKLMIGGAVGFFAGAILYFVTLQSLYSKVGDCTASNGANYSTTVEQVAVKPITGLLFVSMATIIAGLVLLVVLEAKPKQ